MGTFKLFYSLIAAAILTVMMTGCLTDPITGSESGTNFAADPSTSPSISNPVRMICDPFQTNSTQNRERGLVGGMTYLASGQASYTTAADYLEHGNIVDATIYLDRLFVPTRPNDRPFYTSDGSMITAADGSTVYKNFGVRMGSQLQLAANENPGYYQLAVMSSDGAVLKLQDQNGELKTIVNNDGQHPTHFECATEPVYLDHNSKIPMVLDYFQGDGDHITLITMWRPWPSDPSKVSDHASYCGRRGNGLFFNFSQNPVEPKKAFYEMLEQKWKVLENENYVFPEQVYNPCAPPEQTLAITAYSISGVARDRVTLTWTTNIPSTSQGSTKNVNSGASTTTAVDSNLVEYHSVTITGLSANTLYSVKAISTTPSGQSVMSDERAFRTPR